MGSKKNKKPDLSRPRAGLFIACTAAREATLKVNGRVQSPVLEILEASYTQNEVVYRKVGEKRKRTRQYDTLKKDLVSGKMQLFATADEALGIVPTSSSPVEKEMSVSTLAASEHLVPIERVLQAGFRYRDAAPQHYATASGVQVQAYEIGWVSGDKKNVSFYYVKPDGSRGAGPCAMSAAVLIERIDAGQYVEYTSTNNTVPRVGTKLDTRQYTPENLKELAGKEIYRIEGYPVNKNPVYYTLGEMKEDLRFNQLLPVKSVETGRFDVWTRDDLLHWLNNGQVGLVSELEKTPTAEFASAIPTGPGRGDFVLNLNGVNFKTGSLLRYTVKNDMYGAVMELVSLYANSSPVLVSYRLYTTALNAWMDQDAGPLLYKSCGYLEKLLQDGDLELYSFPQASGSTVIDSPEKTAENTPDSEKPGFQFWNQHGCWQVSHLLPDNELRALSVVGGVVKDNHTMLIPIDNYRRHIAEGSYRPVILIEEENLHRDDYTEDTPLSEREGFLFTDLTYVTPTPNNWSTVTHWRVGHVLPETVIVNAVDSEGVVNHEWTRTIPLKDYRAGLIAGRLTSYWKPVKRPTLYGHTVGFEFYRTKDYKYAGELHGQKVPTRLRVVEVIESNGNMYLCPVSMIEAGNTNSHKFIITADEYDRNFSTGFFYHLEEEDKDEPDTDDFGAALDEIDPLVFSEVVPEVLANTVPLNQLGDDAPLLFILADEGEGICGTVGNYFHPDGRKQVVQNLRGHISMMDETLTLNDVIIRLRDVNFRIVVYKEQATAFGERPERDE